MFGRNIVRFSLPLEHSEVDETRFANLFGFCKAKEKTERDNRVIHRKCERLEKGYSVFSYCDTERLGTRKRLQKTTCVCLCAKEAFSFHPALSSAMWNSGGSKYHAKHV